LKQQKFAQSDPILIRQFSKKLQSDPVLIRLKLASVLIQSDPVLIRAHLWLPDVLQLYSYMGFQITSEKTSEKTHQALFKKV